MMAENLAAISVPGYRRNMSSFESYMPPEMSNATGSGNAPAGNRPPSVPSMRTTTDFTVSRPEADGNPTHLAISGDGFFAVEMPGRGAVYTRNGSFRLNSLGEMVTADNWRVLTDGGAPVLIPKPAVPIAINETGEIVQEGNVVGKIRRANFNNPAKNLQWVGGTYFAPNDASAQSIPMPSDSRIMQGFLESSNVSPIQEMVAMIHATRAYEANQKALQAQDGSLEQVIRQVSLR